MIVKLRNERKAIRYISIVLMMALLVLFLAASANAATTCGPKYSSWKKVVYDDDTEKYSKIVLNYRVPGFYDRVVVWVNYERHTDYWQNERIRTDRSFCTVNKRCEATGPVKTVKGTSGRTLGRWMPVSYKVETIFFDP
jgi:hypothetical protein